MVRVNVASGSPTDGALTLPFSKCFTAKRPENQTSATSRMAARERAISVSSEDSGLR
jgi:hypothetical protein